MFQCYIKYSATFFLTLENQVSFFFFSSSTVLLCPHMPLAFNESAMCCQAFFLSWKLVPTRRRSPSTHDKT